ALWPYQYVYDRSAREVEQSVFRKPRREAWIRPDVLLRAVVRARRKSRLEYRRRRSGSASGGDGEGRYGNDDPLRRWDFPDAPGVLGSVRRGSERWDAVLLAISQIRG